jgi:hypothetical protein
MHPTLYGYTACECIVASAPLVELRLREAGLIAGNLSGLISQGCYSTAVAASAMTHAGGGVWDLKDFTPYRADLDSLLVSLGWIDFYRAPGALGPGSAPHHHVVLNGCPHLHPQAAAQLVDARAGLNGLAGKGKSESQRPSVTWQQAVTGADPQTTTTQEDDMKTLFKLKGGNDIVIGDGVTRRHVTWSQLAKVRYLAAQGYLHLTPLALGQDGVVSILDGDKYGVLVREIDDLDLAGKEVL